MSVLYPTIFRRYDVAWQSWSFGCRGMSRRQHLYRRGDCMAGRTRSVTVWAYADGGGCSGASDVDFGAVESEKVKKHRFFFADKKLSSTFASSLRQEHIIGLWCNGNTTDSGPVIPSSNLGSPTPRPPQSAEVFFVALSPSAVVALDIFCYGVLFVNSEEMFLPSFRVCNMDLREECSFAALMFYMARPLMRYR